MEFETEIRNIRYNNIMWDKITEINNKYSKYNLDSIRCSEITSYEKRTSKAKYGHSYLGGSFIYGSSFDFKEFLTSKIFEEKYLYVDIVKKYKPLLEIYLEYEKEILEVYEKHKLFKSIDNCPKDTRNCFSRFLGKTPEGRFDYLSSYERNLLDERTFSPVFPTVKLTLSAKTQYDTYSRDITYGIKDIIKCYELALEKEGKMTFVKRQRAIVSDSLRYDVLRRDNYRCCICGATSKDGVKLEVDHIIPISKGGKSTLDNLQTLCERCNRGKGTK